MSYADELSSLVYPEIWANGVVPYGMHYVGEWSQQLNKINEIINRILELDVFESEVDSAFALQTSQIAELQEWVNALTNYDFTPGAWDAYYNIFNPDSLLYGVMLEFGTAQTDIISLQSSNAALETRVDNLEASENWTTIVVNDGNEKVLSLAEVNNVNAIHMLLIATNSLGLPELIQGDEDASTRSEIHVIAAQTLGQAKIYLVEGVSGDNLWGNNAIGTVSGNYLLLERGDSVVLYPMTCWDNLVRWFIVGGTKSYADLTT